MKTYSPNQISSYSFTLVLITRLYVHANRRLQQRFSNLFNAYKSYLQTGAAIVFLSTLFLGVSYVFFCQLAKYGW